MNLNEFDKAIYNLFRREKTVFTVEEIVSAFPDYEKGLRMPDANWKVTFLEKLTGRSGITGDKL